MAPPMPITTGPIDRAGVLAGGALAAAREDLGLHLGGRLAEADRETAGAGAVGGGEVGGEGIGILVDEEIHAALAVDGDRAGPVAQHGSEAHAAEVVVQGRGAIGRRGEFDELEPVDSHRVLEGGDLHAEVGLGAHGRASWNGREADLRTRDGRPHRGRHATYTAGCRARAGRPIPEGRAAGADRPRAFDGPSTGI